MDKLDITTIILTYNEELHIKRCLDRICPIVKEVFIIDCFSKDRTLEIIKEVQEVQKVQGGAKIEIIQHPWPGNQAEQFNWALDNIDISTEWVLRLDADEYLTPELITELHEKLPTLPEEVSGIELKRRHIFMGKWVKHGIYPIILLRMFRNGIGCYDARLMDEHIVLSDGKTIVFDNDFCDHSLINISDYCRKHINYAGREAFEILDEEFSLREKRMQETGLGKQAQEKHKKKSTYNKLPLFWRSFAYFCYRYFLKGGFLDGKEGFTFTFIQGWWYRMLVDAKVYEAKKACGDDKEKLKEYIKNKWGISLTKL